MGHYAGLDVSLEETAVCVVDETGRIVKEARVPSEPEALAAFFLELGLVVERIGLEACSLAAWLHDGLAAAGLPVLCIETRQAKAAMAAMPNGHVFWPFWSGAVPVPPAECAGARSGRGRPE